MRTLRGEAGYMALILCHIIFLRKYLAGYQASIKHLSQPYRLIMSHLLSHIFLPSVILGSLVACAPGSNDQTPSNDPGLIKANEFAEASACAWKYNEGGPALSNWASYSREIRRTYFGKVYDFGALNAILAASAEATVDFISQAGVQLYKAESPRASCSIFAGLSPVTSLFQKIWSDASRGMAEGYRLQGLYLENHFGAQRSGQATIVVVPDTSRWTLVHEFFHHLFAEEFQKNEIKEDLKVKSRSAFDRYSSLHSDWNRLRLSEEHEMIDQLLIYSKSERNLTILYPLEEVTIEQNLIIQHNAGAFQFVPDVDVKNGLGYIHASLEAADRVAEGVMSILNEVKRDGPPERRSDLANEIARWQDLKSSLAPHFIFVKDQANRIRQMSASYSASVAQNSEVQQDADKPAPCSHIRETLESIKRLERQREIGKAHKPID